jgi:hypothetical protein
MMPVVSYSTDVSEERTEKQYISALFAVMRNVVNVDF